MRKKNEGGPAFPTLNSIGGGNDRGINLRQYYAAHAPITIDDAFQRIRDKISHDSEIIPELARLRFEYADAMIAAGEIQP